MRYTKPTIVLDIYEVFHRDKTRFWNIFKHHHYLSADLNKSARCFVAFWNSTLVAFNSVLAFPHAKLPRAQREHRLVVLPDFQGLGIGNNFSECIGDLLLKSNYRMFTRTANIKLGEYRNSSVYWRNTSSNGKPSLPNKNHQYNHILNESLSHRLCYSHEYVGKNNLLSEERT